MTVLLGLRCASRAGLRPARLARSFCSGRPLAAQLAAGSAALAKKTRNIGIIAHIDAGKTTTTERMLYYAGRTSRIGNVDEGSTVTDFLPAERERGITIQSAVVTLHWNVLDDGSPVEHRINLIDTPGHVDFNFEVIRSLRILDGAVCILDGVAGVEAQTEAVWEQAGQYGIPRIVFVNKMDRTGASFSKCVHEIRSRLGAHPVVCQIPWVDGAGQYVGHVDILSLRALRWDPADESGRTVESVGLAELGRASPSLAEEARKARVALVELLSEHDGDLFDEVFAADLDHLKVTEGTIVTALRRLALASPQRFVPVLCGASFRNIGVQPLLDSVVRFLPNPLERADPTASIKPLDGSAALSGTLQAALTGELSQTGNSAAAASSSSKRTAKGSKSSRTMSLDKVGCCALAFKVVNDPARGPLVYVRVYHGQLDRNAVLYNTALGVSEKAVRVMEMQASESVEQASVPAGQICVLAGLKHVRTGDTLVSYAGLAAKAGSPPPPAPLDSLELEPIAVPPPVFFVALEPAGPADEKHLWDALGILLREDPSLRVSVEPETGQAQLAGLGELHLDIATDRLINSLRARVRVGPVEISYRETVTRAAPSAPGKGSAEREVSGAVSRAVCDAVVSPRPHDCGGDGGAPEAGAVPAATRILASAGPIELQDRNVLFVHLCASADPDRGEPAGLDADTADAALASVRQAVTTGVSASLSKGPRASYPLHSCRVDVLLDHRSGAVETVVAAGSSSTPALAAANAALSASARGATASALRSLVPAAGAGQPAAVLFMEPVMKVTLTVDERNLGPVVQDLSSARGGRVSLIGEEEEEEEDAGTAGGDGGKDGDGAGRAAAVVYAPPDSFGGAAATAGAGDELGPSKKRIISAHVPLAEMVGYNRYLRSLTRGRGTFTMQVNQFERMSGIREKKFLASTGRS